MPPETVAMIQSSYVPWKGYFDQINMADLFVFYDDVQYTKDDWRNRNRIKTRHGLRWITVPCGSGIDRRICDVRIEHAHWQRKHWELIRHSYHRAAGFERFRPLLEELYLGREWVSLSELNQTFIRTLCREALGIPTAFADSRDYDLPPGLEREQRWLDLLRQTGARNFVIGPAARDYLADDKLREIEASGLNLVWMDYEGYPEYRQLFPPFEHRVSILDLLCNEGEDARRFLKSTGG